MILPFAKVIPIINIGLHDLRSETFLEIILGRTNRRIAFPLSSIELHIELAALKPTAVVIDLVKGYHTFVKEFYPTAIQIIDRFHVNHYVTEALQLVHKQVQGTLSSFFVRLQLKQNHRVLGKRYDQLSDQEKTTLKQLLHYSTPL